MDAKTYWTYNVPVAYFKNTPEDVREGCPSEVLNVATPNDTHGLIGYKPRKNETYVTDDGLPVLDDQNEEQFFLTASNMHYELSKQFYQLSQKEVASVPPSPGLYLPEVEIVTSDNVERLRELIRKRFEGE